MKIRPTNLAQYELLHGETEYEFIFPTAPSTELLVDIYADRPCSLFVHIVHESVDRWVPIVSSERRLEFRGRFAHIVGARIHAPKEATINALVVGSSIGVDPIDYTPRNAKLDIAQPTLAELVAKEVRKMLPQKPVQEEFPDPELMGDEIAERNPGYEIEDDDPLDGYPAFTDPDDSSGGVLVERDNAAARDNSRGDQEPAPGTGEGSKPDPAP